MSGAREHRAPLTDALLEILDIILLNYNINIDIGASPPDPEMATAPTGEVHTIMAEIAHIRKKDSPGLDQIKITEYVSLLKVMYFEAEIIKW